MSTGSRLPPATALREAKSKSNFPLLLFINKKLAFVI
jgi:hypothetical protein